MKLGTMFTDETLDTVGTESSWRKSLQSVQESVTYIVQTVLA